MVQKLRTIHDVRKLLQRFGTWVYTGDVEGDLDLIEDELRELYVEWHMISGDEFRTAMMILRQERHERQ